MIVRVRGVKKTRSAAGRVYYYHRATKTRIKAKPNTAEFVAEVAKLEKRSTTVFHVLQVLGTILNWGRPRNLSAGNPLIGLRNIKIARPRDLPRANRPWSDTETVAVLEAAAGGLRLALALACNAGMRGGDIVRVTWTIYDGKTLEWRQGKT